MGNILQFNAKPPTKLGFERVKKRKQGRPERRDQLNLFTVPPPAGTGGAAQIVHLAPRYGPFEEGLLLDERGDGRAQESYWRAIEEGDCVADAYCNLGVLESQAGRTAKAFDCFTKSLELDPRHLESHYNLANLYFEAGDLRLSKMHYEIAAEIEPEFVNTYFNLGLVHAMSEDFKSAVTALRKYKELASEEEGRKADELLSSLNRSIAARR